VISKNLTIGAAYTFLDIGDAKIRVDDADNPLRGVKIGDYNSIYLDLFYVNMVYCL